MPTKGQITAKTTTGPSTAVFAKCANTFAQDDRVWADSVRVSNGNTAECGLVVFAQGVGHGVVAFAGLDLLTLPAGDVEGAKGAVVDLGVGGGVAGEVLGAELVLDLVEGFLEFFAVVAHVDYAAAGVFGHALHVGVPGVAEAAVEAAVGDQDDVDDGVGLLGGLGGGLDGLLGALVASVGEEDENLAAGL